jgi:hypothetical protein
MDREALAGALVDVRCPECVELCTEAEDPSLLKDFSSSTQYEHHRPAHFYDVVSAADFEDQARKLLKSTKAKAQKDAFAAVRHKLEEDAGGLQLVKTRTVPNMYCNLQSIPLLY